MTEGAFSALWTKYLPVLRIMLKKSIADEQQVAVGKLELNAADSRKNANYVFKVEIVKGKIVSTIGNKIISKDLLNVLNSDPLMRAFMADKQIYLSMDKSSQLTLKTGHLQTEEEVSSVQSNADSE